MNSFFSVKKRSKPIISRQKLVNRDKKVIVIVAAITGGIITFSLLLSERILTINLEQSSVIEQLERISSTVDKNTDASSDLQSKFEKFNNDNAHNSGWSKRSLFTCSLERTPCDVSDVEPSDLVLDALPSGYDGDSLRSHLQQFFEREGFPIQDISLPPGDDSSPGDGSLIEFPIEISFEVNPNKEKEVINLLNRSIRPLIIKQMEVNKSSGSDKYSLRVSLETYYQPVTKFQLTEVLIDPPKDTNDNNNNSETQDESG